VVALVALWTTLRQKPIPRKLGVVLAILFLFLAFFHAWRKQLNSKRGLSSDIDRLQTELNAQKDTLAQLQNMKADQTIVQVDAIYLTLETIQPFREGQFIGINFKYANTGIYRVHNFHVHKRVQFVTNDKEVDSMFQDIYKEIDDFNKAGQEGVVVDPGNLQPQVVSTVITPSADEVRAFYEGKKVMAIAIRIEYNDTLYYERCAYLNPKNLHGKSEMWNIPARHNKAGQHPVGIIN